ncbi:unannotated protein [freshwater metagenome]|uniref:Unannotated protein n=1 Tax=freshwater metagenome TaxID=449393 RepID=A0A6J7KMK7_9ZZZZ
MASGTSCLSGIARTTPRHAAASTAEVISVVVSGSPLPERATAISASASVAATAIVPVPSRKAAAAPVVMAWSVAERGRSPRAKEPEMLAAAAATPVRRAR